MTAALTNTVLTIPSPGQFELVERAYPSIAAGYAIIKTEIAPICLEGSRIWAAHDFEFHDDAEHLGHEGVGAVVEVMPGSNFKLGDRVIVKLLETEEVKGGIIIPDTAKERPQEGEIVAVGKGRRDNKGQRIEMELKAGDRVLFGKYAGNEITIDDDKLMVMKEEEIWAIV